MGIGGITSLSEAYTEPGPAVVRVGTVTGPNYGNSLPAIREFPEDSDEPPPSGHPGGVAFLATATVCRHRRRGPVTTTEARWRAGPNRDGPDRVMAAL